MGREQMRNLEVERVGNATVNEFEYHKHQGELTEQEHSQQGGRPGGRKLSRAEQVAQITEAAHRKVEKRKKKEPKSQTKVSKPKRTTKSATVKSGSKAKKTGSKSAKKK